MLPVHIVAGTLALISGAVALYSVKGARAHRRSGMLFVYAMCTMCATGIVAAIVRGAAPTMNIPAAMLTGYLVITGLRTMRPRSSDTRRGDRLTMWTAAAIAVVCFVFGAEAMASGGERPGMAFPLFMFGLVSAMAAAGDRRMLRRPESMRGAVRLARHLWRMCFAFWIAVMSFFLGQADVFPEPLRIRPLLATPVVAVLVIMLYWLRRVRVETDRAMRSRCAPAALVRPAKLYV